MQGHPDLLGQLPGYIHRATWAGSAPLLRIVRAAEDSWISPEIGHRLRDLIPGATLALVPDAGHLVHHDAPAALMDEIRAWLDGRCGISASSEEEEP